jgi:hypothetical protein
MHRINHKLHKARIPAEQQLIYLLSPATHKEKYHSKPLQVQLLLALLPRLGIRCSCCTPALLHSKQLQQLLQQQRCVDTPSNPMHLEVAHRAVPAAAIAAASQRQ